MMKKIVTIMAGLAILAGLFMISDSAARAAEGPIIGDADCSGEVNTRDAQLVLRGAVGQPVVGADPVRSADCLSLGDVDCSATLDPRDALLILRFDAGKKTLTAGNCVIGQPVPDLEEGKSVVSEEPILDDAGRQVGTVVVTGEKVVASGIQMSPNAVTTAAYTYYWSCRSEVYAKNAVGMKMFSLRHYQAYEYNGYWLTRLYPPTMGSSTMPGWSMHDPVTSGITNWGTMATSQSSATFKYLNVPWVGSVQSYRVTAGVYVYGSGRCYPWGSW